MTEMSRRVLLGGAGLLGLVQEGTAMEQPAWGFSFPSIEGDTLALSALTGRVLLVVNTASFCGYTNQYAALQKLHKARGAEGLTVIGIPSQDFNQESASASEVKKFCDTQFGIDFPMTTILKVRGAQADPFYRWVKGATGWEPGWNFCKVLVGRNGRVAGTFGSGDEPGGARLSAAVGAALGARA